MGNSDNTDCKPLDEVSLVLSSSHSTQVSLAAVKAGRAGLDGKRKGLLERVSEQGEWAVFERESLEMMDLAYLTAATGEEFAILRGKNEDVLFHGTNVNCSFERDKVLKLALLEHKYEIYGHSHPAQMMPKESLDDKRVLRQLGQKKSRLISGMTGICIEFYATL